MNDIRTDLRIFANNDSKSEKSIKKKQEVLTLAYI